MITWLFTKMFLGNPVVAWLFVMLTALVLIAGFYQIYQVLTDLIRWLVL
jgi:membrane-bound ClpP family serine protease